MEPKFSFQYETEANASFYVGVLAGGVNVVQYQLKMMENNSIPHLLDIRKYQTNNLVRLCYNVTGRMSLAQITERHKLQKQEFLQLVELLLESANELNEYQLPLSGLILDENSVFVKPGSMDAAFIYLPIYTADNGLENIRSFVQKMIVDSRISISSDNFIQKLLDLFNETDLTLDSLREKVADLGKQPILKPFPADNSPEKLIIPPSPQPPILQPSIPIPAPVPQPPTPAPQPAKHAKPRLKKGGLSGKSIAFAVVQVAVVALLVLAAFSGFFLTEDGAFNSQYAAGAVILVGGLDFVLYRELFVNNKPGKGDVQKNNKKHSKGGKKVKPNDRVKKSKTIPTEQPVEQPLVQPPAPAQPVLVQPPIAQTAMPPVQSVQPFLPNASQDDDWDKTEIDNGSGFGDGYLEYYDNGLVVRIHLTEGVVRVGSHSGSVDHVLPSKRVSKVHAEFIRRGDRYFVKDINSTNGTFVNGSQDRIVSNQEVELLAGCKVRLANIEMVFKC